MLHILDFKVIGVSERASANVQDRRRKRPSEGESEGSQNVMICKSPE